MEIDKKEIKIDKKEIKRILIIRFRKIGDVLFTTPLIRALKKGIPRSKITYIVNQYAAAALENNPYIDNLLVSKGNILKPFIKDKPYDLAINLHPEGNGCAAQLVYLSGAKYRIANSSRDRYLLDQYHNIIWHYSTRENSMIEAIMKILNLLELKSISKKTEIFLTGKEKKKAFDYLKNKINTKRMIIGLHPACDISKNHWKNKKWAKLADRLTKEYKANILLFQGPDEYKTINKIKKYMKGKPLIIPSMNLRRYIGLVSQCDYFFTLDSGPLHVAQALDIPVIALFIESSPRVYFDYKKGTPVTAGLQFDYKKERVERVLEVDEVLKRFDTVIKTQPFR